MWFVVGSEVGTIVARCHWFDKDSIGILCVEYKDALATSDGRDREATSKVGGNDAIGIKHSGEDRVCGRGLGLVQRVRIEFRFGAAEVLALSGKVSFGCGDGRW